MSVTEVLEGLGSWRLELSEQTPEEITSALKFFGHVAVIDGPVDVVATGDGLLAAARYVGVLRDMPADVRRIGGSGMVFWLGDEDDKGAVLVDPLDVSGMTMAQAIDAVLTRCPAVHLGTVFPGAAGTLGAGTVFQFVTARKALTSIVAAFGREFRVNGNATLDVGTAAQLYTDTPDSIIVRRGAGSDIDLTALGGQFDVDASVYDYTTDVTLLGRTDAGGDIVTGSAGLPGAQVPYRDRWGNTLKIVRLISESGETSGTVNARAQLQLNRFARTARSLKVTAEDYETRGNFRTGDNTYVYDPDTGIVNAANEVIFGNQPLHPDVIRVTGMTWQVVPGMTVAYRGGDGVWLDLTPYVTDETGTGEITVGDLPGSLTRSEDIIGLRVDTARATAPDTTVPAGPANLVLTTTSTLNGKGQTVAVIHAAWDPVTLNTDDSVINDLSHYVVQYRWTGRAPLWSQTTVTDDTEVDLFVPPSLPHQVRVAAVDIAGHDPVWSAVVGITSSADTIAPPAPADPVVTSYLGQLRIEYVGTDAGGQPMPTDTKQINVHVGTTVGFTATTATRVASVTPFAKGVAYATAPYGSPRYVRLIAEDHDGNFSPSSAVVPGSTVQVGDGDIAALSVGKLTAGTMSADVIMGGRFTTAPFGARREMNGIGFQAFDANEALTINLDGVNNLLTGILKTARTGRRIEIGAAGAVGEINMYSPDGRKSFLRAWTEGGGVEAVQLGIEVANSSSLWNRINYNSSPRGEYATYRSGTHEFVFDGGADQLGFDGVTPNAGRFVVFEVAAKTATAFTQSRLLIRANETKSWADIHTWTAGSFNSERAYLELVNGDIPSASARLRFMTSLVGGGYFGGMIKYVMNPDTTNYRFEFLDWSNSYAIPLWASAFVVASDRGAKEDIRDLAAGSLDKVRALRPRWYRMKTGDSQLVAGDQLGLIAQEAPAEIVSGGPTGLAIDLYALAVLNSAAIAELATIVDTLGRRAA